MTEGIERTNHLFVVRLWREAGKDDAGPWRGSVQHVATGRRRYYTSMVDLTEFITERLESPQPGLSENSEEENLPVGLPDEF